MNGNSCHAKRICGVMALLLAGLLAGCVTQKIDWAARVGHFTFDQAVLEFGPPDKHAKLDDGTINAKNLRGGVGFMGPGMGAAGPYHHYTFELFALDTKLDLGPDATRADVLAAMQGHILAKGVLEGRFHK